MQPKRIKRDISGVLLLDKPLGISSNQALQKAKWLYQAAKAGHTGSLDPLASGLLPVCFGEATKFSHFLLDADKSYRALIRLGITTTTGDAEGEVTSQAEADMSAVEVARVLEQFTGEIKQIPPMHSALKHHGRPLYEYARSGVEITREARPVTIYSIELCGLENGVAEIIVACSKGTYIRSLAEDIGKLLGCGAHLAGLRRIATGHFKQERAITLEQLENMSLAERDEYLLPTDAAIDNLPKVVLDEDRAFYLMRGQEVWKPGLNLEGLFRIYTESGKFLGVGEQTSSGKIAPRRLVAAK